MIGPELTVRSIDARLVLVPMRRPLHTSVSRTTHAPLLLIDLDTQQGITGRTYLFCYLESIGHALLGLVRAASELLADRSAQPAAIRRVLDAHFKLPGAHGPVASLSAGLDVAAWDVLAQAAQLPLVELLGGQRRPLAAYNSNGLGLLAPRDAAGEASELVAEGMLAIKMRVGRTEAEDDLAAVTAVRDALPDGVELMVDYNQALSLPAARERLRLLDEQQALSWIEEPVRHDDYDAAAELASQLRTPLQIGENFAGPRAMAFALARRASDLVMPDLDRIGGVTGWLQAAALADVAGVPMSSHLYPEVSAHLLAVTPTAHWLEYVDWARPILSEPLAVTSGAVNPSERPGVGLHWDEKAVASHRIA